MNYTNYMFYINEYGGDMPSEYFDKVSVRASYEVQRNIFGRDIKGYETEVQMATCSVADILYQIELAKQRQSKLMSNNKEDRILSSETVADVSRSFANTANVNELNEEISNQKSKIREAIRTYLEDTGLMFRGV